MEAAQGRSRKAVVAMALAPSCRQPHAWSASSRHQKRLPCTSVALIAMHVSRHHREGFRALEKWRYKRALHGAAVRDQGTVRIGWVVQQHQYTPDRRHALKVREFLLIPSNLDIPVGGGKATHIGVQKDQPQGPVDRREPMAPAQLRETGKEVGEPRMTRQTIIMVAKEWQDGHARLPQRESQLVECGPSNRGGPPQDEVTDNRQKVGALSDNLVDQLASCLGIRLAPDLETGGGLQVTYNGEPPALDVDRPAIELPWWRQMGSSEALLHTAAHRARES